MQVGDHIYYRYEIEDCCLGRGSFGAVLRCFDHATGHAVAVKVIRNKKRFQKQAAIETDILALLQEQVGHISAPHSDVVFYPSLLTVGP